MRIILHHHLNGGRIGQQGAAPTPRAKRADRG
jgi:hypothetical protein